MSSSEGGRKPAKGEAFNVSIVSWIRYKHRIPALRLKRPEELTVKEVAGQFRVSAHVVYYWLEHGIIEARRLNHGAPYWITLDAEKKNELCAWVRNSTKLKKLSGRR